MIDSWTIAKGLLLYTAIVIGILSVLKLALFVWSTICAAIAIEDARAEKEKANAEERGRLRAQNEAAARCDAAYKASMLGKASREE